MYWFEATPFLLWKALPQWPYLQKSDHVFSSRKLSRSLNKIAGSQLQNSANKKAKELSLSLFASIIILANKNGCGAQGWPLFLQFALSLQKLLPLSEWISSLQNLLPLLQEHTKSTKSPKTTKKLRLTWLLGNSQ